MFLVQKSDGSFRPIFDLRGLNSYIKTKHFQLISHAVVPEFLQKHDWMVKIDLSQAYFHVPISVSHRCFLRLVYNEEILEMTALPFGLSPSPQIFAALTNWIAEILRKRGIRVLVYLDDFLVAHQDKKKLISQTAEVVNTLELLGWWINYQKAVLNPMQKLEYLGVTWDTMVSTISLSKKKKEKILHSIEIFLTKQLHSQKQVQKLLGQLNFATFVVPRGRLYCRQLQIFCRRFNRKPLKKQRAPPQVVVDLRWWRGAIHMKSDLHPKPYTNFLTTDAADTGWGAQIDEKLLSGGWTKEQKKWHSNRKELYAVYAALSAEKHHLRNADILVQSDNRTLVAYIRKEGGTHSLSLLALTRKLLILADRLKIRLSAQYLPGRYNCIADNLSRGQRPPEWHLLSPATNKIFNLWGTPDVDLFASAETTVVNSYVSLDCKDRLALFSNAFSHQWDFRLGWIFPPPNLMPRVLDHWNLAKGRYIIVAPVWEKTFWMADLKSRALANPMEIENLQKVLVDVSTNLPPAQVDRLALQAWLVGGGAN
ncbi:uncharacterized protein LOC129948518 [Eupeodes corollae]|uniref:uncharacterized protein LOC129948518 n=1 Tax=Eupeodes corollae TaxID=290404 RepID=UPI002490D7D0|nr:uncharacterized protein LOC129948518 [Eupeodes corollae]